MGSPGPKARCYWEIDSLGAMWIFACHWFPPDTYTKGAGGWLEQQKICSAGLHTNNMKIYLYTNCEIAVYSLNGKANMNIDLKNWFWSSFA